MANYYTRTHVQTQWSLIVIYNNTTMHLNENQVGFDTRNRCIGTIVLITYYYIIHIQVYVLTMGTRLERLRLPSNINCQDR